MVLGSELIGVMYGRTAREVVAGIKKRYRQRPPRPKGLRVIPVCAEPLHLHNAELDSRFSSTYLAAELHESLTGQAPKDLPSLRGVPAYVAADFGKATLAAIREFVSRVPGYRRIFIEGTHADPRPLIERVDTILTGIGTPTRKGTYLGAFIRERLAQETTVSLEDLRRWVFGDIGGVLLSRPGLDAKARKAVEAMNAGLLCLTAEHFRDTAKRASQSGKPGCVVVAGGRGKGEVVCAAVQLGMVNELVVNGECAAALESLPEEGVLPPG
jgi:DNA-binding transcriptional regulator LsrR (DeoR family)